MRRVTLNKRTATHLSAALAVALVAGMLATALAHLPQATQRSETLAVPQSRMAPATQEGTTDKPDTRPEAAASSRGGGALEQAKAEGDDSAGTGGSIKTSGLAAPSPLQAAAAALAARNTSGRPIRVGIQAGHWKNAELPDELASLRGSTGAMGTGWTEVDVNLNVAQKVTALLSQAGVAVDLIPATVPVDYKADAFVAIHADANSDKSMSGFKAARAKWSTFPDRDDALLAAITRSYQAATGLAWNAKTITPNMLQYYAFNRRFSHSVDAATPSVILEMGFLTNADDRRLLLDQPDVPAQAIALGVLSFLAK